ncbi:hypothetical protein Taro_047713 [Colocasia esculenta]|uniref:Uncharacterized protein n=1 Tax=Colocasia esculenta TaxID=4460 RepID=A0A843WWS2_COLES|nr:hypothetical protein [Colocasia esculenta]
MVWLPIDVSEGALQATVVLESGLEWRTRSGGENGGAAAPNYCFGNQFLGVVCCGTRVCSSLTSWSARGARWFCLRALDRVEVDIWLFLPNFVEVQDVGACVLRLWSHVVALVYAEVFTSACVDSAGSAGVIFGLTRVVVEAFTLFPLLCSTLQ